MNIGFKLIIEYRVEVNFLQVDVQDVETEERIIGKAYIDRP